MDGTGTYYDTMKRKIFLSITLILLFGVVALFGTLAFIYSSQNLSVEKLENHNTRLLIYDKDSKLIKDDIDYRGIKLKNLPTYTPLAFVAVEDKNFQKHNGVSWGRIAKASVKNIQAGRAKEGASTISQQLIKNTHLSHEKTMQRKLREASLAHKLEKKYSKNEILEMYLNAIYFGNGIYGIEGASRYYFGKSATELTVRESAALAGMLRSPAYYCPITKLDNFSARGDFVMRLMREQGHITRDELNSAREENLLIVAEKTKREFNQSKSYKQAASIQAAKILNLSNSDLASFGYRVFTYYDQSVQETIVKTASESDYKIKNASDNLADCVIVSAMPHGEVNGFFASTPTMIGARRNFASTMKPLVVYTPALELGVVSPSTYVEDAEFNANGFNPRNYDNKHRGLVTVRESVIHSHNIPAVKVLNYTRIDRAVNVAKRMGLFRDNAWNFNHTEGLGMALGNTADGTTFDELLAGYCTLANGGIKTSPSLVRKIEDRNGRVVWTHHKSNVQVIGEDTAFLMTDMLVDTTKEGTAKKLKDLPFDVAAKTGTAERGGNASTNTDAVCVAYTPDTTLIVWYGNASMKPENDLAKGTTGGGITAFVTRDIMKKIQSNNESKFEKPMCVEKFEFDLADAKAGKIRLASEQTPTDQRASDYFSRRYAPREISGNFLKPTSPTLDGKISDTGVPLLWFDARPSQVYEIYKRDAKGEKLQEVIKGHTGEYLYFDKSSSKGNTNEYFVVSKIVSSSEALKDEVVKSNTIKLVTDKDGNKDSAALNAKKKSSGKQWFF